MPGGGGALATGDDTPATFGAGSGVTGIEADAAGRAFGVAGKTMSKLAGAAGGGGTSGISRHAATPIAR